MSVCLAIGSKWHGPRQTFRLAWHMGLFQFLMPIAGWVAGQQLTNSLSVIGTYLAAGLVFGIGAKMLYEAWKAHPGAVAEQAVHHKDPSNASDPTRGWSLVILSIAASLDALIVGFSLGLKGQKIWQTSVIIGLVAGLMALVGVLLGKRFGEIYGKPAEIVGAAILMGLGICFIWL